MSAALGRLALGRLVLLALPLGLVGSPAMAGSEGRQLAAACAGCHGAAGGTAGIPSIVGEDAARILQAMHAYRTGERPSQIMHVVADALSPAETEAVARYLAALPAAATP